MCKTNIESDVCDCNTGEATFIYVDKYNAMEKHNAELEAKLIDKDTEIKVLNNTIDSLYKILNNAGMCNDA